MESLRSRSLAEQQLQLPERSAAMTEHIFLGRRHVCGTLAGFRIIENRIVAKSARPIPHLQNESGPQTLGDNWLDSFVRFDEDGSTMKCCGAVLFRNALEFVQQFRDVLLIRRGLAREACGPDTGPAADGVDGQAGVVRNCRQTG